MRLPLPDHRTFWRMATEYPASNISGVGLSTFARLVSQRTHVLTIEPVFDSPIGSCELLRVAAETPNFGGDAFAGPLEAIDPLFGLSSLPFVVQSAAEARDLNEKARPAYEAALARRGMTFLYFTVWPPTGLWSHRPLDEPQDIRSLAIRVYDHKSAKVMQAAGAKAEYLSFSEAIEKVSMRTLNAILTSGDGGAGLRLWDALTHYTAINYAIPVSIAFIRTDAFEALSPDVRTEVIDAARETAQLQFDLLESRTDENFRRMRENGVTISDTPHAMIALLRESATETLAVWKESVPADIARLVETRHLARESF